MVFGTHGILCEFVKSEPIFASMCLTSSKIYDTNHFATTIEASTIVRLTQVPQGH
jgi:hypothetical protein